MTSDLQQYQASFLRRASTDTEWAALVRDRPVAEALAARLSVLAAQPTAPRPSAPAGLPGLASWETALAAARRGAAQ
ncbi:hypothetical protein ADK56_03115 [Streptomyces sp. MMG1522]|uniref:hypothetical protein n=1 Tax=Streptomyces sp. MMG1522 TaxID=1415545 RepID=UPI0006AFE66C|nr:hypothetical protein [Streptomyces sp. MMG1522]KOU55185.1 hypothetical protein ADK56_03115 [Streptomyces sp. MMG1522]